MWRLCAAIIVILIVYVHCFACCLRLPPLSVGMGSQALLSLILELGGQDVKHELVCALNGSLF